MLHSNVTKSMLRQTPGINPMFVLPKSTIDSGKDNLFTKRQTNMQKADVEIDHAAAYLAF